MATPYTPASSLLSPGRIGRTAWVAAIARHNPVEAATIVATYHTEAPKLGINPDLALAQAIVESAWFTSALWRMYFNPCGLGITGPGVYGKDYDTPRNGITAHLHHLCCYAYTTADCPVPSMAGYDDRHWFHDGNPRLSHLQEPPPGRQWATGAGYVGKILGVANTLLLAPPQPPGATKGATMPVPKPATVPRPSPNRNGYAGTRRVDAVIWHVTAGGEAGSLAWLTNPSSGASSNYLIGKDGTIYELVPPTEDAWANGAVHKPDTTNPLIPKWIREGVNFNQRTVSIEVVRETSAQGQPGGFTPAQYKALVTLTAYLCQEFKLTPDRVHIFGHRTIDSVNRPNCPGLAESEWFALVAAVAALVNGATPPPTQPNTGSVVEAPAAPDSAVDKYLDPITGHTVAPEVRSLYDWLGGLAGAGRPRKPLVKYSDGVLRQLFDNMVLEFDPASGKARIGGLGIAYEMAAGQYPIWGAIVPLI